MCGCKGTYIPYTAHIIIYLNSRVTYTYYDFNISTNHIKYKIMHYI